MNAQKFVTLTLNASLDRTLVTHYFALGYQNWAEESERLEPGGQGLHIAQALNQLECQTQTIILLGNDLNAEIYQSLLPEDGLDHIIIPMDGRTSTATYILDTGNDQETRIRAVGEPFSEAEIQSVSQALENAVNSNTFVILAGTLPPHTPKESYARLLSDIHAHGAETMVAVGGPELEAALAAKPAYVALSQIQCEGLFNIPVRVMQDLVAVGRMLRERGAGSALLEMRDHDGAVLISADGLWQVDLPEPRDGTTSGVWEALLAGFLAGRCRQQPLEEALEKGGSAAAYTAHEIGFKFGSTEQIQKHHHNIDVHAPEEDQSI